ncbi:MAG: FecR domain-containing protein [Opitutaceae bacterium]
MSPESQPSDKFAAIEAAAAAWLARRDRQLTATEQDEYLEWLRADPRHAHALAFLEKTWGTLDALAEWRPTHSARPNPDLLAGPRPRPGARLLRWSFAAAGLAAACFVAFSILRPSLREPAASVRVIPSPERITLADGSVVELNQGGKIAPEFTPETRRVRLLQGEAHFTVTKNSARPFIVEADGVAVRAVGTAFGVRQAGGTVEVLVTEGKVQVERPTFPAIAAPAVTVAPAAPTPLVAGERAVVDTRTPAAAPVVATVSADEIARALAWQGVRLEFKGLPLAEVVAEFNLRNRQQLVVADIATGRLRVGGNFRADNVDGFVRLLEVSFGVTALRRDDGALVLRRQ